MIDVKTLIHKTSVDPRLRQLRIRVRNQQRKRAPEKTYPVVSGIRKGLGLLLAGGKIVSPEELKKNIVDKLQIRRPGSTKMITEGNIFCWSGMRRDIEINCITCTACISSGNVLKARSCDVKIDRSERSQKIIDSCTSLYGVPEKKSDSGSAFKSKESK